MRIPVKARQLPPRIGMRKERSPFPTEQGIALAKDAWMTGIGLGLVIDDLTDRPRGPWAANAVPRTSQAAAARM